MRVLVALVLAIALAVTSFLGWGPVVFASLLLVLALGYGWPRLTDSPQRWITTLMLMAFGLLGMASSWLAAAPPFLEWLPVLTAMGLRFAENIVYYVVTAFSVTYLKQQLKLETTEILYLLLVANAVHALYVPWVGRLSDRVGRRPLYALGAVLTAVWPFVAFPLWNTRSPGLILLALLLGLAAHGLMYAVQPAIMSEMFPTRMRYSGVSLGYQVTAIVAGSVAPLIATALLSHYHSWVPIALYLVAAAAVTLVERNSSRAWMLLRCTSTAGYPTDAIASRSAYEVCVSAPGLMTTPSTWPIASCRRSMIAPSWFDWKKSTTQSSACASNTSAASMS